LINLSESQFFLSQILNQTLFIVSSPTIVTKLQLICTETELDYIADK